MFDYLWISGQRRSPYFEASWVILEQRGVILGLAISLVYPAVLADFAAILFVGDILWLSKANV